MIETYLRRFLDRSFEWVSTSGLRVILITVGMILLFTLLQRLMGRFRLIYEGRLAGPTELKRADTLTGVNDVVFGDNGAHLARNRPAL